MGGGGGGGGSSSSSSSPCASCKLLRRRCAKDCIFAPYFPPDDPHKFAIVHKVFGASNISKMLQEIPVHQRGDAVSSLVYEANARMRDPVNGCVGAISYLQNQVAQLQVQLAVAQAEILRLHQLQQQQQQTAAAILPVAHIYCGGGGGDGDHQTPQSLPVSSLVVSSPSATAAAVAANMNGASLTSFGSLQPLQY
ncbi:unnamed protein product [Cuscuta campestris]|uniref:LOB domain-containing protein n=2 Tax=Cuscuta sect. Cleistogrammica TaxID=1824901 RepID=A0A484NHJ5_9ASTE|nr:hypothetical protein DM860_012111 [Cuscuta australis]VFR00434.1 unnamed protein product [Cuscuta campestris]